jgi:hypothetical protein
VRVGEVGTDILERAMDKGVCVSDDEPDPPCVGVYVDVLGGTVFEDVVDSQGGGDIRTSGEAGFRKPDCKSPRDAPGMSG